MLTSIATAIAGGLAYLEKQTKHSPPAFFPTTLLLSLLEPFQETHDRRIGRIVTPALRIIRKEQENDGAFIYWRQGTMQRTAHPYPSDLDDTALAYVALHLYGKNGLNGSDAASFAALLIRAETAPGGPYNTWLTDFQKNGQWSDIDPAVNANVAFALRLIGVRMPRLESYLCACLIDHTISSLYYPSQLTLLYFISRAYDGPARSIGKEIILAARQGNDWGTPLRNACAISALLRWGESAVTLKPALAALLSQRVAGHWPAERLYLEQGRKGRRRYFGSARLTTAFCLEALELARQSLDRPVSLGAQKQVLPVQIADKHEQDSQSDIERIISHPFWSGSLDWAEEARIALGNEAKNVSQATVNDLRIAQLSGLCAYGIYDDIIDGQSSISSLPAAMTALRRCLAIYNRLLPGNHRIARIFSGMEEALHSEAHGRLVKDPSQKSLGAALPVLAVAILANWPRERIAHLEDFFRGLFAARQWHDDAHDYQEDRRAGRVTPVTVLLQEHSDVPGNDQPVLPVVFWQRVFPTVLREIHFSVQAADHSLVATALPQPAYFRELLNQQYALLQAAQRQYEQTCLFLKRYAHASP